MPTVRHEQPRDIPAIRQVHTLAFAQPNEAELVETLREACALTISLVALQSDRIVGHIAFSPVTIVSETSTTNAIALGPMAVLPTHQRTGLGTHLVTAGLDACRATAYGVVVVLGHSQYYPRFGFTPSQPYGITWAHDAPADAFMIYALQPDALTQTRGVVYYHPAFAHV